MILYKQKPFNCKLKNVMLLDAGPEEDSVVYVSKNTYDQCVMLYERFEGERGTMCKMLNVEYMNPVTVTFFENAPQPVNMLAPYLGMLSAKHSIEEGNWEQMYGYLHILSQITNFNGYLSLPAEARADLSISRAILKSYKESWEDLTISLTDLVTYTAEPGKKGKSLVERIVEEEEVEDNEGVSYDVDEMANADSFDIDALNALLADCAAEAEAEVAAESKKPVQASTPVPATSTTSVPMTDAQKAEVTNAEECDAIADSYDGFI